MNQSIALPQRPINFGPPATPARWRLERAAAPYSGMMLTVPTLDRPGYRAAAGLFDEFTARTGITVAQRELSYLDLHAVQAADLREQGQEFDALLFDCVWIGEFVSSGWLAPLGEFYTDNRLADPQLRLSGFFPVLLNVLGTWRRNVYGLPFDAYAGLLFYNTDLLAEAGLAGPPASWGELLAQAPLLTGGDRYAFGLPSVAGETQVADSFLRMLRMAGGELLDPTTFEPRLSTPAAREGLEFRRRLLPHLPPEVTSWDHHDALLALTQDRVAMVTDWNPGYQDLAGAGAAHPAGAPPSHISVAVEPLGLDGDRHPPLGGFSYGVNARVEPDRRHAAWLLVQYLTSTDAATRHLEAGGSPARRAAYADVELRRRHRHIEPLVQTWSTYADPAYRPRFPEYPQVSDLISEWGLRLMQGEADIPAAVGAIEAGMRQILGEYLAGTRAKVL